MIVVTGGAGYIGAPLSAGLAAAGQQVRVLDSLLHGQDAVVAELEAQGVEVVRGDVRDPDAREQVLRGARGVVHLAAIVGDPACASDPQRAREVNVEGTRALIADAGRRGRGAFRVRLDLLQLRADGRSNDSDRRGPERSRRCRSTPSRRWRSSGCC